MAGASDEHSTLVAIPSAGRGEIRLELLAAQGVEAGRARFERLVTDIVKVIHPTAREVKPNPGDWGIDTFVGRLDGGTIAVWQSKFFLDDVGKSQQAQIRKSFKSVLDSAGANGFVVGSWTLAMSGTLDAACAKWWDGWSVRQRREHGVEVQLWDEAEFRSLLMKPDFAHVRSQYFGESPTAVTNSEREVQELAAPDEFDGALFIAQLHAADILNDGPARRAFFNAEVMTRDINERESAIELAELSKIRSVIEQKWHTRFEAARADGPEAGGRLPRLYPAVCTAIEDYHTRQPSSLLRDSLIHRTGLIHHLAEDGQVGWVDHFSSIAADHRSRP